MTGRGIVVVTSFSKKGQAFGSLERLGSAGALIPRQRHLQPLMNSQHFSPPQRPRLPPCPRHATSLLQRANQILSSWTVQWKVSPKRQYIIFHEFNRVFMILQSASTRHSQLEAAQREAEACIWVFQLLPKSIEFDPE